jgi:hypothetical protein
MDNNMEEDADPELQEALRLSLQVGQTCLMKALLLLGPHVISNVARQEYQETGEDASSSRPLKRRAEDTSGSDAAATGVLA